MAPIPGNNREEPEKVDGDDTTVSSLDAPQFTVQAGSSDSDEEVDDTTYAGYQLLPQEPGGEVSDTAVQDADDTEPSASSSNSEAALDRLIMRSLNNQDFSDASAPPSESNESGPDIPMELAERKELWNTTKSPTENIKIDSEKADKIRAAMVGFKLPRTHVPEWAKIIPEDQWKTKLIDRLSKSSKATNEPMNSSHSSKQNDDCSSMSHEKLAEDSKT